MYQKSRQDSRRAKLFLMHELMSYKPTLFAIAVVPKANSSLHIAKVISAGIASDRPRNTNCQQTIY